MQARARFHTLFLAAALAASAGRSAHAEPATDAAPEAASETPACAAIFEESQGLRKQGKLKAASELLIRCSQPSCSTEIARTCTDAYTDVQKIRPSITLVAKDNGQQLIDVQVRMDGELIAEKLDGRAILIDPGVHDFQFAITGKPPLLVQALVTEGEKNKLVIAEFSKPRIEPPPSSAAAISVEPLTAPRERRIPVASYVVGGVGLAAIAGGLTLRFIADSEFEDLKSECRPNCTGDDKDPVRTKYILSTAAFGAGAAALVTAGVIYLATGESSERAPTGLTILPAQRGAGAVGSWVGHF